MTTTDERPPLAAPRGTNPFHAGEVVSSPRGGLVAVEQQRAIAEVQAQYFVAKSHPRDPVLAMDRILNACTRPTLAQAAVYQYARGGTDIRGPSIRLIEAIGQVWGNMICGVTEMARHPGYSECVAFAVDLESGFSDRRQFQVRHWRDTKQGGYALTDERDIYEAIANFGARRKRAALIATIPGDVIEAALEQCERTMTAAADVTPEGIRKLAEAFAEMGVTQPQIEARIQRHLDAIRPAQVVALRKVFNSLKDGMSAPADWFEAVPLDEVEADAPAPQQPPRRGRGRPPRQQQQQVQPPEPPPPPEPPRDMPATSGDNIAPPAGRGRVQFEV